MRVQFTVTRLLLGACLVAICLGVGITARAIFSGTTDHESQITISSDSLSVATAWASTSYLHAVFLTNPTAHPVTVSFRGKCRCTSFEPQNFVLLPHATRKTILTLDTTSDLAFSASGDPWNRPLSIAFSVIERTDRRDNPVVTTHRLSGTVKTPCIVSPPHVLWRKAISLDTVQPVQVRMELNPDLTGIRPVEHDLFKVVRAGTKERTIRFAIAPKREQLQPGAFSSEMIFEGVSVDSGSNPTFSIPINGYVEPAIHVLPLSLAMRAGDEATLTIQTNLTPFTILMVGSNHPGLVFRQSGEGLHLMHYQVDVVASRVFRPDNRLTQPEMTIAIQEQNGEKHMLRVPVYFRGPG